MVEMGGVASCRVGEGEVERGTGEVRLEGPAIGGVDSKVPGRDADGCLGVRAEVAQVTNSVIVSRRDETCSISSSSGFLKITGL